VPRDLETIGLKCLEKEPRKRYATAETLGEDLDRYLAGRPIAARRTPAWERGLKWARRRPATAAALAIGLALIASGLWYEWLTARNVSLLRARISAGLLQGQAYREQRDWTNGKAVLSNILTRIEAEPRLADLRIQAVGLLVEIERGLADQARYLRFLDLRDEAFFRETRFTELGQPDHREAAWKATRAALEVFAARGRGDDWALEPLPVSLSARERDDVERGCYELLLVGAEAVARARTGESPRQQAEPALRLLDAAARLRAGPSRAYHLRRAACLARAGDAAGAARARAKADRIEPQGAFDQFLSGLERYQHGDLEAASRHFHAALKSQPDHFWARCLLAVCHLRTQQPDEAKVGLTACLQTKPGFVWLYLYRGFAYGGAGELLQKQAKLMPPGAARWKRAKEAADQFEAAEADYNRALDLQPGAEEHVVLLLNRGVVRLLGGRLADAAADLRAAIRRDPSLYQPHASLAEVLVQQGQLDAAIAEYSRAVELKPDMAPLYRSRALLRLKRPDPTPQDRAAALHDLEQAIRLDRPDHPLVASDHALRGELLYLGGHNEEALAAATAALKIVPDLAAAYRVRVRTLLELRRFDEVIAACDGFLARGQPSADLHGLRGLARVAREDYPGAIADYTLALTLRPGVSRVHAYRGWAYLFTGAAKLALADFEEAVRLDPTDSDSYNGRGSARVSLRQHREAVADAEHALRRGEPTPRELYNAARIYAQAAAVAAVEVRPGQSRRLALLSSARYEDRALVLIRSALARLPVEQRGAFARETIAKDPSLLGIRKRLNSTQIAEPTPGAEIGGGPKRRRHGHRAERDSAMSGPDPRVIVGPHPNDPG
jgi:tetratricopeptide (TPR) repeat protein